MFLAKEQVQLQAKWKILLRECEFNRYVKSSCIVAFQLLAVKKEPSFFFEAYVCHLLC